MTPEDLTWNMEQMAERGIGSVEITPIYGVQGNEANEIDFLSPQWINALRHTINEGQRLGIAVDMNMGTGWPFGSPTTPIEEGACKLIVLDTLLSAEASKDYHRITLGAERDNPKILPVPAKEQATSRFLLQEVIEKSNKQVRVITLYEGRTRQKVKRAAPGGEGLVIDHLDSIAVAHYLQRFDDTFGDWSLRPRSFFNDSYEVYKADWTPTMFSEFRRRRGYALEENIERFIDGDAQIISDYRETMSDLLLDNFTRQWVRWCHDRGITVRNQAHGSPANLLDLYAAVDIPEIEGFGLSDFGIRGLRTDKGFTKANFSDLSMLKYASSAANVTGKKIVSSETFTWLTEHFRTSLSQMKPDLDLMFCAGVNSVMFHGSCFTPKDAPWPGWQFYASVDFTPSNSIWRDLGAMTTYIEHCQQRLQEGRTDNDFLILLPIHNMWRTNPEKRYMMFDIHTMNQKSPEFISAVLRIDSLGYGSDYISERQLLQATFRNGMIETAGGGRYHALIIPGSDVIMTDSVRNHINELQHQGANITYDISEASLARYAVAEEIRRQGLKMLRRHTADGRTMYFIANLSPNDICRSISLAVPFRNAEWYDPMTDKSYTAETISNADGKREVIMDLRSGESRFLFTSESNIAPHDISQHPTPSAYHEIADLTHNAWHLHFIESQPAINDTIELAGIKPWHIIDNDSIRELMGTGVYETEFTINPAKGVYRLDLGDIRESARVYINDRYIGTAWAVPMTLDFDGDILCKGNNHIRIEVTNLPANRIAAYDRRGIPWRRFKDINVVDINYKKTTYENWLPMPSGINGMVKVFVKG